MQDAQYWIDTLKLEAHPEGGYFRETFRSPVAIPKSALPHSFGGDRSVSTAIYFLLKDEEFSAFHRIASDEVWHFYAGSPLSVHVIDAGGEHTEIKLGRTPSEAKRFRPLCLRVAGSVLASFTLARSLWSGAPLRPASTSVSLKWLIDHRS